LSEFLNAKLILLTSASAFKYPSVYLIST